MRQMMTQLDWDYISLVYTEDPDFIAAKDQLLILAAFKRTVCVGQVGVDPTAVSIHFVLCCCCIC